MLIGNAVGGNQFVSSTSLTAAGRSTPVPTAAQLAAMAGLTTAGAAAPVAGNINLRVTTTGAGPVTAGAAVVTVRYAQQALNSAGAPVAAGIPV
jgi:hypothetical protein